MTVTKVYRDATGVIVNIGEWNYGIQYQPETDAHGDPLIADGATEPRIVQVVTNPLPIDVTEGTADIIVGWDGGLYAADDPRRLKQ